MGRLNAFVDVVLPVFALLGIGYAAAMLRVFDETATRALSRFVFQFALPLMLFSSLARQGRPADFAPGYLVAFFAGVAVAGLAGGLLAGSLGRNMPRERIIVGFTACYGNVILLGIPLVLQAFGEAASLPLFVLVTFHGPILMTAVTILLERAETADGRRGGRLLAIGKGIFGNPILLGLFAGIAVGVSGLAVPEPVMATAELLGRAGLPTALFAMGASLAVYRIRGALGLAMLIVGLKTILQPLIVWLLVDHVFAIASPWSDVAIVLAAMPSGVNAYLFATRYRSGEAEAATAILISTAFSLLTVSLILGLRLG